VRASCGELVFRREGRNFTPIVIDTRTSQAFKVRDCFFIIYIIHSSYLRSLFFFHGPCHSFLATPLYKHPN